MSALEQIFTVLVECLLDLQVDRNFMTVSTAIVRHCKGKV